MLMSQPFLGQSMNAWQKVRGMLITALTWAVPWAFVGGAIFLTWGVLTAHPLAPLRAYFTDTPRLFFVGSVFGGAFGAISGLIFAALLARRERNRDIATLSIESAVRLGALSGAASVAVPMLIMASGPGRPFLLAPVALFTAAAGAASAFAMIKLARRGLPSPAAASADAIASAEPVPPELAAAQIEVEQALWARHNITTLGADGRVNEAGERPRFIVP